MLLKSRYYIPRYEPQFVLSVVTVMRGVWPGETIFTLLTESLPLSLGLNTLHLPQLGHCHGLDVHQTDGQGTTWLGFTAAHLFLGRTEVYSNVSNLKYFSNIFLFVPKLERYFSPVSLITALRFPSNISTS